MTSSSRSPSPLFSSRFPLSFSFSASFFAPFSPFFHSRGTFLLQIFSSSPAFYLPGRASSTGHVASLSRSPVRCVSLARSPSAFILFFRFVPFLCCSPTTCFPLTYNSEATLGFRPCLGGRGRILLLRLGAEASSGRKGGGGGGCVSRGRHG